MSSTKKSQNGWLGKDIHSQHQNTIAAQKRESLFMYLEPEGECYSEEWRSLLMGQHVSYTGAFMRNVGMISGIPSPGKIVGYDGERVCVENEFGQRILIQSIYLQFDPSEGSDRPYGKPSEYPYELMAVRAACAKAMMKIIKASLLQRREQLQLPLEAK